MSTKWTYWKCERISWECLNVHTFQNPMWCLPMSLSHWVPLNSVPLAFLVEMFLVFYLLNMFLHSYLHAVSHVSSPCFSLFREVSWLQKKIDPIFKASWTLSVCIVWIGKWKTPKSTLEFVAPYCFAHPLHLSFKDGGGCQKLTEDLFSSLVMLRKGDSEKWRKAGRSVIASTWKYS